MLEPDVEIDIIPKIVMVFQIVTCGLANVFKSILLLFSAKFEFFKIWIRS